MPLIYSLKGCVKDTLPAAMTATCKIQNSCAKLGTNKCSWKFKGALNARCKQSKVDNVSYIISMFPVCGGLPVHLWHGRQGLPPESHLRDARVPSPWLRPRWRAHQHLPHVRLKPIAVRLDADYSVLQPKSIIVPEQDGGVHQRRGDGQAGRGVLQV